MRGEKSRNSSENKGELRMMIECAMLEKVPIEHPMVAASEVCVTEGGVLVAVMLRPLYGRVARQKVLSEVAESVRRYLAALSRGGRETFFEGGRTPLDAPVYVCADVDVYQAILHDAPLDLSAIASRAGCYKLQ